MAPITSREGEGRLLGAAQGDLKAAWGDLDVEHVEDTGAWVPVPAFPVVGAPGHAAALTSRW